mmetsp:Transcript_28563/g.58677  ORF Transcript_28563/g.58677 Transcript_28563/m.58677 type:complete len:88 (-) Transcript_28563:282-545(-)
MMWAAVWPLNVCRYFDAAALEAASGDGPFRRSQDEEGEGATLLAKPVADPTDLPVVDGSDTVDMDSTTEDDDDEKVHRCRVRRLLEY